MEKSGNAQVQDEDGGASGRALKYAVIAYAVVEFIAVAFVVYYKATR